MDRPNPQLPRLSPAQAAARLGIQASTLRAYVSRNLIDTEVDDDGTASFDAHDIDSLAAQRQRHGDGVHAAPKAMGSPGTATIELESDITLIEADDLFFRGTRAVTLAAELSFEDAARLLWSNGKAHPKAGPFTVDEATAKLARRAHAAVGKSAGLVDGLTLAVLVAGSHDPLRYDLSADVVGGAGERIIAAMVESLPGSSPTDPLASMAERLWSKLSPRPADADDIALLDSALVLCMDHDIVTSTLAARVAASARAHPYAAVAAPLGAFDSRLLGSGSIAAHEMLEQALRLKNPERALAMQLHKGRGIAGFSHRVYTRQDPRAAFLLDRMRQLPRYRNAIAAADGLIAAVDARAPRPANVDLALGALAIGAEMQRDAGQLIFAVARTAGWIAHIVDEYSQPALRMRPDIHYVGPLPKPSVLVR